MKGEPLPLPILRRNRFHSEGERFYRGDRMTPGAAVQQAKRELEAAERRLVDVRFLRDRLTRALPEASSEFRPTLEDALARLVAVTPRLEREFDQSFDCLRALAFLHGLNPERTVTRSVDWHRGPRKYREKKWKASVR